MLVSGFAIPVVGVRLLALSAMKIGVDGHGVRRLHIVDEVMRAGPVAFAVPPESDERRRETGGRSGIGEGGGEFGGTHGGKLTGVSSQLSVGANHAMKEANAGFLRLRAPRSGTAPSSG